MTQAPLTLDQARVGEDCFIGAINDPDTAMIAMRLGVSEGERVTVISRIPGGPVVIRQGERELALGRSLCQSIEIQAQPEKASPKSISSSGKPISCLQ
jgi:Fe2+ transport system protein FeoA